MSLIATVISPGLHLRSGPGDEYGWEDKLTTGDEMEVTGSRQNGWVPVRVIKTKSGIGVGQTGWVYHTKVGIEKLPPDVEPACPPSMADPLLSINPWWFMASVVVVIVVILLFWL